MRAFPEFEAEAPAIPGFEELANQVYAIVESAHAVHADAMDREDELSYEHPILDPVADEYGHDVAVKIVTDLFGAPTESIRLIVGVINDELAEAHGTCIKVSFSVGGQTRQVIEDYGTLIMQQHMHLTVSLDTGALVRVSLENRQIGEEA